MFVWTRQVLKPRRKLPIHPTHLRRLTTLAELANVAAFMASDQASGMTGTVANLTGGAVVE